MIEITYEDAKRVIQGKHGKWFTKPYDLNLFGIRNPNPIPDKFDDTIGCAYTDPDGNKRLFLVPATTDPGLYYLQNPMNPKGCAILKEGYYMSLWTYGKHKGYDAFIQTGTCVLIRDANRDGVLNFESTNIEISGPGAGINLHKANPGKFTQLVDKYSAGCQVVASEIDFLYLVSLLVCQRVYTGCQTVSYALMNEMDFEVMGG